MELKIGEGRQKRLNLMGQRVEEALSKYMKAYKEMEAFAEVLAADNEIKEIKIHNVKNVLIVLEEKL